MSMSFTPTSPTRPRWIPCAPTGFYKNDLLAKVPPRMKGRSSVAAKHGALPESVLLGTCQPDSGGSLTIAKARHATNRTGEIRGIRSAHCPPRNSRPRTTVCLVSDGINPWPSKLSISPQPCYSDPRVCPTSQGVPF